MKMIWELLKETLIFTGMEAESSNDVMKKLGGAVIHEGYARDDYVDALIAREEEYPTGLLMDGYGVAIPHTDASHVTKSAIAIAVLKNPVRFIQMATDDDPVDVQLVFMLVVDDPKKHMDELQKILMILQDKEVLTKVYESETADKIISIIKEKEKSL